METPAPIIEPPSKPDADTRRLDVTIEDALHTASRFIGGTRFAGEVRELMAADLEVEVRGVIRRHHDGNGFCVAFDVIPRKPARKAFWRTKLV